MTKKRYKLTEAEWNRVFEIRCRSKRGQAIQHDELRLCERAMVEDSTRYSGLTEKVFEATLPFGARAKS